MKTNRTVHAIQRMSQRGITGAMVNLVLEHGKISCDKAVLGRKDAQQLLTEMRRDMKILKKILDKGGVVVVAEGDRVITTYNYKQYEGGSDGV